MAKKDQDTSDKIKASAKRLFTQKGFGRTTTRDIASDAGINLALVNYYFGSKDELFQEIMLEALQGFLGQMRSLLNDDISFEEKTSAVVTNYIELLKSNPELPIFMLSEIRNHPEQIASRHGIAQMLREASYFKEMAARCPEGITPIQLFINLLSLTVFPFVAKPLIKEATQVEEQQFNALMEQRKEWIPRWFLSMLKPKS